MAEKIETSEAFVTWSPNKHKRPKDCLRNKSTAIEDTFKETVVPPASGELKGPFTEIAGISEKKRLQI